MLWMTTGKNPGEDEANEKQTQYKTSRSVKDKNINHMFSKMMKLIDGNNHGGNTDSVFLSSVLI